MQNFKDKLARKKSNIVKNCNLLKDVCFLAILTSASFNFFSFSIYPQNSFSFEIKTIEKKLPFGLKQNYPEYYPVIALALSGGGSRGFAHIGALKILLKENIHFSQIYGISIGSLIGGMLSCGYNIDDIDSILTTFDWEQLISLDSETSRKDLFLDQKITEDRVFLSFNFEGYKLKIPTSVVTGQKFSNYLSSLFLNAPINFERNFDNLIFKYRAIATNLLAGNPYSINNQSLSLAVRASSAISLLVSPVEIDSLILVDGGMTGNIPVSEAKKYSDYVIAVDATTPLLPKEKLNQPLAIADQMISIPINILALQEGAKADCLIKPDLKDHRNSEFNNFPFLISQGEKEAQKFIPKIRNDLLNKFRQKEKNNSLLKKPIDIYINDQKILIDSLFYFQKDSVFLSDFKFFVSDLIIEQDAKSAKCEIYSSDSITIAVIRLVLKPKINKIDIAGCSLLSKNKIYNYFDSLKDKHFNSSKILKAILDVLTLYRKNGYPFATLDSVNFDSNSGVLFLKINETFAQNLEIEGLQHTKSYVVKREFAYLKSGRPKINQVLESLNSLKSSNLFSFIDLHIKEKNGKYSLIVNVKEKPSNYLRFGIRADNENKFIGMIDLRNENLNGSGSELGLNILAGVRNRYISLEHKSVRLFNSYLTYRIFPFYEYKVYNYYSPKNVFSPFRFENEIIGEYKKSSYGVNVSFGAQLEKFGNLIFTISRFSDNIIDKNLLLNLSLKKYNFTIFKVTSTIDTQDKYPYPDKGFYSHFTIENSLGGFYSDIAYVKVSQYYKIYIPFNSNHNLSMFFNIGYGDETLPFTQQFTFGGQNNFFGFRENERRGRQIFILGSEYRYKIPLDLLFPAYIKASYNIGNIWQSKSQIRYIDLYHGLGLSLSFKTPLGPLDFSAGQSFKLKKIIDNFHISKGPIYGYFSLGYMF